MTQIPSPAADIVPCTIYIIEDKSDDPAADKDNVYAAANYGLGNIQTPALSYSISGFWKRLSAVAVDAAGNLYLADPEPTQHYGNYPNDTKVSSNDFLPAIFSLSAATTPDPFKAADTLLEDWTTSAASESTTSSGIVVGMHKRHSVIDYSGIVSIALAKPNSDVLLYAVRSRSVSAEVLIVPSTIDLHAAISTMYIPSNPNNDPYPGETWIDPLSVSVSANQLYGGSDSVFIADSENWAVHWYNADSDANSDINYLAKITGDGLNTFGNEFGKPIIVAASSVMEGMIPRLYIALSTSGVVYYTPGSTMQPLSPENGCDFAATGKAYTLSAMSVDKYGNLYLAAYYSSSNEVYVCLTPDAATPYIFLGGDHVVTTSVHAPKGIAAACS